MYKYILCLLLLVPCAAYSDQRGDKTETSAEAQEKSETQQKQIDTEKTEDTKQATKMDQKFPQFNPTEEDKAKLQKAATAFISTLQKSKTAQQLVDIWAKFYGAGVNDKELDKLAELGKEDVKASQDAMLEFALETQPIIKSALDEYLNGLRSAIKEYKYPEKK